MCKIRDFSTMSLPLKSNPPPFFLVNITCQWEISLWLSSMRNLPRSSGEKSIFISPAVCWHSGVFLDITDNKHTVLLHEWCNQRQKMRGPNLIYSSSIRQLRKDHTWLNIISERDWACTIVWSIPLSDPRWMQTQLVAIFCSQVQGEKNLL